MYIFGNRYMKIDFLKFYKKTIMMKYPILIIAMALGFVGHAQRVTKEFYNEEWKKCDSITAKYYREITYDNNDQPIGQVKDFYITGQKEWEGQYYRFNKSNTDDNELQGTCTWYYENGHKKKMANYHKGVLTGQSIGWFENGNRMYVANYSDGLAHGLAISWYETGLLRNYGVFAEGKVIGQESIHCNKYGECTYREQFPFKTNSSNNPDKVYSDYTLVRYLELNTSPSASNSDYQYDVYSDPKTFDRKKDSVGVASKWSKKKGLEIKGGKKPGFRTIFKPLDFTKYFSLTTNISFQSQKGNKKSGMVFGYKDKDNYQFFVMNEKGEYEIGQCVDGVKTVFVTGNVTKSQYGYSGKTKGKNYQLKVYYFQDSLRYMSESEELYKKKGINFSGEYLGFYADAGDKISATNLLIRYDADPPFVSADVDKKSIKKAWRGSGSGLVVSTDGYVITNHHVVNDATDIQIDMIRDGNLVSYDCEMIIKDEKSDLAIIKIKDSTFKHFSALPYSVKTKLADVGAEVFTLGYPLAKSLGSELKYTDGAINARTGFQGELLAYQISVPLQPGNSGGPLFDKQGNLVGVVNSKLNNATNVGFAIKANYIINLMQMLPSEPQLPESAHLAGKTTEQQISILRPFVPMIKVR